MEQPTDRDILEEAIREQNDAHIMLQHYDCCVSSY
jgi:hypothetical protein